MLILLPILAWGSFFLILHRYHHHPWREALLRAMVIWGVTLAVITELLSGLQLLTPLGVSLAWFGVMAISTFVVWRYGGRFAVKWPAWRWRLPLFPSILLAGVAWIVAITGVLAIASAPNNPDSMGYHMSRVMHWIQQGTVAHYPTHNLKQLYQNPGSEFAITQFQLLSGGDYFANSVQWGSMVMSLVGVSLIARQLGCDRRGQLLAVVLCATIPMGILQAASTQNDYVLSLWLVCFTYFSLLIVQAGVTRSTAIYIGASLGLVILSKGTGYIYAFPPSLALLIWTIRQRQRSLVPLGFLSMAIALTLNIGHYLRNLALSGSLLGVDVNAETNNIFSLPVMIASFFRHLSLHADWVRTLQLDNWITPTTGLTEKAVSIIHTQLGLDLHHPDLLSPKSSRFYVPAISQYEDTSGNPLHLILIGLVLVLLVVRPDLRRQRELGVYALTLVAGFLMISSLLTWSPWRTRLHLPIFVLFTPIIARVLVKTFNPIITGGIAIILLLSIQPWLFENEFKPILGEASIFSKPRLEQYFTSQPRFEIPYQSVISELDALSCHQIGISNERIWFEYPLWMLLKNQEFEDSQIVHVAVKNPSSQAWSRHHPVSGVRLPPCALLSITSEGEQLEVFTSEYGTYTMAWSTLISNTRDTLELFVPN